jgi:uncharacterized protein YdeI (YjbR/CyaY-like superfamily)
LITEEDIHLFATAEAYGQWLEANGAASKGFWMKISKAGAPVASINYQQALDVSLCWGWIDGQKRPLDAVYWLQRFSPRKPRSIWSKINTEKADRLVAEGRMRAPGLAAIEAAKADGRWGRAYEPASKNLVPPELQEALDRSPQALAFFRQLDSQNRYAFVFRTQNTKNPQTRAARVEKFLKMLEAGEVFYPRDK